MTTEATTNTAFARIRQTISLLFSRPRRTQVAALCHREGSAGREMLLITSRKAKRLMIPKGWPSSDLPDQITAQKEAFEEAGIIGSVATKPIGAFNCKKGLGNGLKVKTRIIVYPLKLKSQTNLFPESGQRKSYWMPLEAAIERCEVSGLKKMLQKTEVKKLLSD